MSEELRELLVAVTKESQYAQSAVPRAVLFLLHREEEREHEKQVDYERRMME